MCAFLTIPFGRKIVRNTAQPVGRDIKHHCRMQCDYKNIRTIPKETHHSISYDVRTAAYYIQAAGSWFNFGYRRGNTLTLRQYAPPIHPSFRNMWLFFFGVHWPTVCHSRLYIKLCVHDKAIPKYSLFLFNDECVDKGTQDQHITFLIKTKRTHFTKLWHFALKMTYNIVVYTWNWTYEIRI